MQKTLADYEKRVYELFDPLKHNRSLFKIAEAWYDESNLVKTQTMPKIAEEKIRHIKINSDANFLFENIRANDEVPEDEMWVIYESGKIQKFKIV